jgi:cyclohexadienyl dehydratase
MSLLRVALLPLLLLGSLALQPARAAGLDDIVKAGVLRVCTPGDYKPFAFQKPDGTFEGIDVDLMQSLAASLSVKVEWVKTSWSNLMADFTGGKCDIAVGGISVTLDRQKRVAFSTAYMVNGKTPLVRCADVAKYQTVADIDKPGVKVIANPGGSNERFAKANFKNATVTIHTDNITIFDEVLKGNADVFVTE